MPILHPHVVLVSAARHGVVSSPCRFIAFHHLGPLLIHLSYFVAIDLLGFLALLLLNTNHGGLGYVDMLFMSTSAVTVTGLATVRMEHLSGSQMVVLTVLMLLGSDMFVSLLGFLLQLSREPREPRRHNGHDDGRARPVCDDDDEEARAAANPPSTDSEEDGVDYPKKRQSRRLRCLLALVVSAYMAVVLLLGSLTVFLYVVKVGSARDVLANKGISVALFSSSVTVSSFTNAGLLPTNESMAVFATNPGLLLLLVGQILAGGTLFPVFLRLVLRATSVVLAGHGEEGGDDLIRSMSKDAKAAGFAHHLLLPCGSLQAKFVAVTAVTVAAAAVALLCCLDWDAAVFAGLTAVEKTTNALFMAVNARQAGENSVDCSLLAPAVLVLFAATMSVSLA
jgi:Trk-type K+ transport system membrane component